jgi:hypothetical protein
MILAFTGECPFKTPLHARDGTAQVERLTTELTWAAAAKTLSNFQDDGS